MKLVKNKFFWGGFASAFAMAADLALILIVHNSAMLPPRYFFALCALLGVLTAVGVFFAFFPKKLWLAGDVCLVLLMTVSIVSAVLVDMGVRTLKDDVLVALPPNEDVYCSFVRADDTAKTPDGAKNYVFGYMESSDRDIADSYFRLLERKLGTTLHKKGYDSLEVMINDLLSGREIQAIVIDPIYIDVANGMMPDADVTHNVRVLYSVPLRELGYGPSTEETTEETTAGELDTEKPFIVYINGIDSYRKKIAEKGSSDMNILAVIHPKNKQIFLLNTPRDTYIDMAMDGALVKDKLTHTGLYGIEKSIEAMESLYGIKIDYYFKLNFEGVKKIINALGGVTVYSDRTFTTSQGFYFEKGMNFMDGASALAFARDRIHATGGDLGRGQNQIKIIRAAIDKVLSPALLLNYSNVLKSLKGSFVSDIPYELIAAMVQKVISEGSDWDVVSYGVPGEAGKAWLYTLKDTDWAVNDIVRLDEAKLEEAKRLLQAMLSGGHISIP